MLTVEAVTTVQATPEQVLAFVMDPERYRTADRKITRVRSIFRDGNEAVVTMRAQLRGLPVPARQRMTLTPGRSIVVRNVPSWRDRLADFTGTFTCERTSEGTRVTHRYQFDVRWPLRPLFERLFGSWLDAQIHEEVMLLREILDHGQPLDRA